MFIYYTAVIESLTKKAKMPPTEDFVVAFQKVKFGINLISKLGHHLQHPSAPQLLDAFFTFTKEFVKRNKRYCW